MGDGMCKVKTVLFDLDGTLTDSGPGIIKAVGYAFEKAGLPVLSDEERSYYVGPPLREAFIEKLGVSNERAVELVALFREYYVPYGVYDNSLYDGVAQMLEALHKRGFRLIICSSKPQHLAEKVTQHFDIFKYFEHIAAAELSGKYTEKNAIITRLSETYDLTGAYMVGDRCFDVEAAKHIGIKSVGVTWGYGSRAELEEANADYIADSTEQLVKILEEN